MAVNKNHFHFYFYPLNTSPAFVFNNNEYLCHLNLVTSQCIHTHTHTHAFDTAINGIELNIYRTERET